MKIGTRVTTKDSMNVTLIGVIVNIRAYAKRDGVAAHYAKKGWVMIQGKRPDGYPFTHFADPALCVKTA